MSAYHDSILPFFRAEKAAEGITCLGKDADSVLGRCEVLGEKIAQR